MTHWQLSKLDDDALLAACLRAAELEIRSRTLTPLWRACWDACVDTKRQHLLDRAVQHAREERRKLNAANAAAADSLARTGAESGETIQSPGHQAGESGMGIFKGKASSSGGNGEQFEIPPADNHPAACVAIVDLGTQRVDGFQGAPPKDTHQVYLVWELTEAKLSGTTNNHLIGHVYTLSYHEKAALRLMLEGWRGLKYPEGEEIDLGAVLGKPCLLSVIHQTSKSSGKQYAKIKSVAKLPKGMPTPQPQRKPVAWEMGSDADGDLPTWLPYIFGEPVKEVVERAKEYGREPGDDEGEPAGAGAGTASNDDDIAF